MKGNVLVVMDVRVAQVVPILALVTVQQIVLKLVHQHVQVDVLNLLKAARNHVVDIVEQLVIHIVKTHVPLVALAVAQENVKMLVVVIA